MGLLDPKLDKPRTFELLRKKGATKAVLVFYGGHDEGDVESITLHVPRENGEVAEQDLVVWYCGGYFLSPDYKPDDPSTARWVPGSEPANEDEELSDLLQGPINEQFGSWGGVESTSGILTWDVAAETCVMDYDQDEPVAHHEEW